MIVVSTALILMSTLPHDVAALEVESLESYVFEAEGQKVDCERGWITVPESHVSPNGSTIRIPFVRFKATTRDPGTPLIYLSGGPGASGIATMKSIRFNLFMKLRAAGDVIVLDQRGTGGAEPKLTYDGSWDAPLDRPADYDVWTSKVHEKIKEMVVELKSRGIHLEHYNTKESAADINALRRALGLEKISLWGTSYGTHLSMAVMRYHGEHVDRVVLSGAEGPDHTLKLPSTVQQHLEMVAEMVDKDPELSKHIPDFMALVRTLLDQLEAKPVTVKLSAGRSVTLGRLDLAMFIAGSIGRRSSIRPLPMTLYELSKGSFRRIANIAYSRRVAQTLRPMPFAMDCASGASPARLDRIFREDKETLLGNVQNFPFDRACHNTGLADLGDEFRAPLRSDIPVLFISGSLDARTPIANAEELRKYLPTSYHVIVENAGHDEELFSLAPELDERMITFLRGGAPSVQPIIVPPVEFVRIHSR